MLTLPLRYFGNRTAYDASFFEIVAVAKTQRKQRYRCCFDVFAGSGSLTLMALEHDIADEYLFNDAFKPVAWFWRTVQKYPKELIQYYQTHVANYKQQGTPYYQQIQNEMNPYLSIPSITKEPQAAAIFAFLINHAKDGMIFLTGSGDKQQLICGAGDASVNTEDFVSGIQALHQLIKDKKMRFESQDFMDYAKEITADDIVLLDPPYPDMEDAEEKPDAHIYWRTESKYALKDKLENLLKTLEQRQTDFLMFYGVLEMPNPCPIRLPRGHVLHRSGNPNSHFKEYVEHLYLSPKLARVLTDNLEQGQDITHGRVQPLFYQLFELHAQQGKHKNGDRPALVWQDSQHTYAELNTAVNKLTNYFIKQGLTRESLVALYLPRGPQLITAILAVMKSGAAYLPLDAENLDKAAAYQRCQASGAQLLLTHEGFIFDEHQQRAANSQPFIITVQAEDGLWGKVTDNCSEANPTCLVSPNSLAYVMYTSGSTGEPKGVEILQRGLTFAYESHQDLLNLSFNDRILQFSSIGFDASLMEILMALGSGATLYLATDEAYQDKEALTRFIKANDISVMIQTPKMLETLNPNDFPQLRAVLIVGDKFETSLAYQWIPNNNQKRQVINGYGLTETTICTTLEDCQLDKPLSIGEPILGLDLYLRPLVQEEQDKELGQCTVSHQTQWLNPHTATKKEPGALYVSGICLARGYWQQPALTKQRFITIEKEGRSICLYQTGDVGHYHQGKLVITGRLDRQIKLRGQRLELGEIEAQIKSFSNLVSDARVVVHTRGNDEKQLAVYIVPSDSTLISSMDSSPLHLSEPAFQKLKEVQQHLAQKIPHFMVVAITHMLWVEALPRKSNDKKSYDDSAMAARWPLPCHYMPQQAEPNWYQILSSTEQLDIMTLRNKFASLLGIHAERINLSDNFYDWGGDSITDKRLFAQLKKQNYQAPLIKQQILYVSLNDFKEVLSVEALWQKMQENARLTLLQHGSTKTPPLYLIHSIVGDGHEEYQGFAKQLGKHCDISIYGLRARGYEDGQIPSSSIEEMAKENITLLLKQQHTKKDQPYLLAGWSSGGLIAFEMSRQLKQSGYNVHVYLFDTIAPTLLKSSPQQHAAQLSLLIKELARQEKLPLTSLPCIAHLSSEKQIRQAFATLDKVMDKVNPCPAIKIAEAIALAELTYSFASNWIADSLHLFIASETRQKYPAHELLGWGNYKPASRLVNNTSHFSLLTDDTFAKQLALQLKIQTFNQDIQNHYISITELLKSLYTSELWLADYFKNSLTNSNIEMHLLEEHNQNSDVFDEYSRLLDNSAIALDDKKDTQDTTNIKIKLEHLSLADKENKILIVGMPGSGKTFICKYLIKSWGSVINLTNRFKYIFYIKFDELSTVLSADISTFSELIRHLCFPIKMQKQIYLDELSFILQSSHSNLFILDNIDKTINFITQESQIGKLISQLLLQPHIIATSQYEAVKKQGFNRVIYNKGFEKKAIHAYIKDNGPKSIQEQNVLHSIIDSQSALEDFMSIPVNLAILCHASKELANIKEELVLTDIYLSYIKRQFSVYWKNTMHVDLEKIDNILNEAKILLEIMGKMALRIYQTEDEIALMRDLNTIIQDVKHQHQDETNSAELEVNAIRSGHFKFSEDILEKIKNTCIYTISDLNSVVMKLNFIITLNDETLIKFHHQNLQAFFAAYYISEGLKLKKGDLRHKEAIQFIVTHLYDPRLALVWQFVAGLSSQNEISLQIFWNKINNTNVLINTGRITLLMRCLNEVKWKEFSQKDGFLHFFRKKVLELITIHNMPVNFLESILTCLKESYFLSKQLNLTKDIRNYLTSSNPELQLDAAKVLLHIDRGNINAYNFLMNFIKKDINPVLLKEAIVLVIKFIPSKIFLKFLRDQIENKSKSMWYPFLLIYSIQGYAKLLPEEQIDKDTIHWLMEKTYLPITDSTVKQALKIVLGKQQKLIEVLYDYLSSSNHKQQSIALYLLADYKQLYNSKVIECLTNYIVNYPILLDKNHIALVTLKKIANEEFEMLYNQILISFDKAESPNIKYECIGLLIKCLPTRSEYHELIEKISTLFNLNAAGKLKYRLAEALFLMDKSERMASILLEGIVDKNYQSIIPRRELVSLLIISDKFFEKADYLAYKLENEQLESVYSYASFVNGIKSKLFISFLDAAAFSDNKDIKNSVIHELSLLPDEVIDEIKKIKDFKNIIINFFLEYIESDNYVYNDIIACLGKLSNGESKVTNVLLSRLNDIFFFGTEGIINQLYKWGKFNELIGLLSRNDRCIQFDAAKYLYLAGFRDKKYVKLLVNSAPSDALWPLSEVIEACNNQHDAIQLFELIMLREKTQWSDVTIHLLFEKYPQALISRSLKLLSDNISHLLAIDFTPFLKILFDSDLSEFILKENFIKNTELDSNLEMFFSGTPATSAFKAYEKYGNINYLKIFMHKVMENNQTLYWNDNGLFLDAKNLIKGLLDVQMLKILKADLLIIERQFFPKQNLKPYIYQPKKKMRINDVQGESSVNRLALSRHSYFRDLHKPNEEHENSPFEIQQYISSEKTNTHYVAPLADISPASCPKRSHIEMVVESQEQDNHAKKKAKLVHDNKDDTSCSETRNPYVAVKTKGGGDCAFHASLGKWDKREQQFICNNVPDKRQQIKEAILASINQPQSPILKSVLEAIREAIMDAADNNKTFHDAEQLNQLVITYKNFLQQQANNTESAWQQLEAHAGLISYVSQHGSQNLENKTIKDRFIVCINNNWQEVEQCLHEWHLLETYQSYNALQTKIFDWDSEIIPAVINVYVNAFIVKPGQWLLPGELNIIAHTFNITVNYYPDKNSQKQTFNPGQEKSVTVVFNGINHFERAKDNKPLHSPALSPDKTITSFAYNPSNTVKTLFRPESNDIANQSPIESIKENELSLIDDAIVEQVKQETLPTHELLSQFQENEQKLYRRPK